MGTKVPFLYDISYSRHNSAAFISYCQLSDNVIILQFLKYFKADYLIYVLYYLEEVTKIQSFSFNILSIIYLITYLCILDLLYECKCGKSVVSYLYVIKTACGLLMFGGKYV